MMEAGRGMRRRVRMVATTGVQPEGDCIKKGPTQGFLQISQLADGRDR